MDKNNLCSCSQVCVIFIVHNPGYGPLPSQQISLFVLYTYLCLCTAWKHVSRLFNVKKFVISFFFLFLLLPIGSVTKLDLLVHFNNNQSLWVGCVKVQPLRLLKYQSECHSCVLYACLACLDCVGSEHYMVLPTS